MKTLYILGVCAIAGTCGVSLSFVRDDMFGFWLRGRDCPDPQLEAILNSPGIVARFKEQHGGQATEGGGQKTEVGGQRTEVSRESVPPLVAAAQAFALILDPPLAVKPAGEVTGKAPDPPLESKLPVRPAMSSVNFKLVATSYYAGRPDKSMALLAEPGNTDGGRWVKEGTQIGHFTVHEIRQGVVVLRDGDSVRELAVERTTIQRNLVKEVRPAASQARAVIHDGNEIAPAPNADAEAELDVTLDER